MSHHDASETSRLAWTVIGLAAAVLGSPAWGQGGGGRAGALLGPDGLTAGAYARFGNEFPVRLELSLDLAAFDLDEERIDVLATPVRLSVQPYLTLGRFQLYALAGGGALPLWAESSDGRDGFFLIGETFAGAGFAMAFREAFVVGVEVRRSWAEDDLMDRSVDLGGTTITLGVGVTMDFVGAGRR